jgi:hypothetical protein
MLRALAALQIVSVAQMAISALAKLASYTPEIAEEVVTSGCLADVVDSMKKENVSVTSSRRSGGWQRGA